jgi:isoleucyl-tRNA synthetase
MLLSRYAFMHDDSKKNEYSGTLNLPKTDFALRAQASITDAIMLQRWDEQNLNEKTFNLHSGQQKFILHDGPPYSNGNIHLGHAYNKILKDIVCKSERMSGKHVPVIPGWDCHGLPIELKVTQEQKFETRADLQKACRVYAQKWIDIQREEFKKLGIFMRFDKPFTTMDFSYEAKILRAFGQFVQQGFIAKKLKTVPWCASCQTVLANAEIEYAERKDPSLYVPFPFDQSISDALFPVATGRQVSLLVWTTTPWTLPLNRAVVLHPGASYCLVEMNGKLVILGKELVEKVAAIASTSAKILQTFVAEEIIGKKVMHPFIEGLLVPVIGDGFVSLEDGTACVHSAPGCGPEDYEVGVKNNLEIYSPLSSDGKYTSEILPAELNGMSVVGGQIWVIKKLAELDRILFKQSIRHSYPHCWRCHQGLIFRATSQWFCELSKHDLKDRALEAISKLTMYPETGKNRFSATLQGRLEWCLSRQRTWGVPIPALNCQKCGHVFTSPELIEITAQGVAKSGIEFWDKVDAKDLGTYACSSCAHTKFNKEFDILDVWFESGVSHYAVLYENPEQQFPADMYLEGKDQHRAWFQSSLLTALVLEKCAPMHEIVTHGFTVDAQGKKMSKSVGNVVTPDQIISQIGTDGLRLWVASNDYDSDPTVSELLLKNVSEVQRKIRNTCRFLLSNLYDFNFEKDGIAVQNLFAVDKQALVGLHEFNQAMQAAYRERKAVAAFAMMADYCAKNLSSLYLDVVKDRLYVEKADSLARRSAQTVCYQILDTLTKAMAPILSFTAEQVFDHYKSEHMDSIHLQTFAKTQSVPSSAELAAAWQGLERIRNLVLKSLEEQRALGAVRHSLDARVALCITAEFGEFKQITQFLNQLSGQSAIDFFKEYFIVSQVELQEQPESMSCVAAGIYLSVSQARGAKCPRCWQWSQNCTGDNLCHRCVQVLK